MPKLTADELDVFYGQARIDLIDFCIATDRNYDPQWFHEQIAFALQKVESGEIKRLIIECPPRHGKQMAHDTPVLTTEGWKNHGDLRKGDFVFGRDGSPKKVLALSEETESDFEVTSSDGERFWTHGKHEWLTYYRPTQNERIFETEHLAKRKLFSGTPGKRGHRYVFQIDRNVVLKTKRKELELHPYVLGAWLGDGSTTKNCLTYAKADAAVRNKFVENGYLETAVTIHRRTGVLTGYFKRLYGELKREGLLGRKFIPEKYLLASEDQRRELLAGLVDTDGSVDWKTGRIRIVTVSQSLAEEIAILVRTLGSVPHITFQEPTLSSSGIQGRQRVYTIAFQMNSDLPVALERKRPQKKKFRASRRALVSVVKTAQKKKGRCIQVEGGIYLVGKSLLPTHNSELATIKFPAWYLGRHPDKEVITASYASDLASKFGAQCRDLMREPKYGFVFPNMKLKEDTKAKDFWRTNEGGGYMAVGVGGPATGSGANIFLIDDPTKNKEESDSETMRDKVWDWYTHVARTRLEKDGAIVIIMTRWHQDDLVGRVLEHANAEGSEPWTRITLKAIAEEDEPHRKTGESLWPQKYSADALRATRADIQERAWFSLYQQTPIATERQAFRPEWLQKTFTDTDLEMRTVNRYITIDTADTAKEGRDYIGVVVCDWDSDNQWFLQSVKRYRLNILGLVQLIFDLWTTWKPITIGVEKKSFEDQIKPLLKERSQQLGVYPVVVELQHKGREKESRILGALQGRLEAGRVYFRKGTLDDTDALKRELLDFPASKFDDLSDCMAYLSDLGARPFSPHKQQPTSLQQEIDAFRAQGKRSFVNRL